MVIGTNCRSVAPALAVMSICLPSLAAEDVIFVTASRSPEQAAEAPLSVSVLGLDAATRALATHPADILNRAAGVMVQAGSGQEHLTALRSPVLTGGAGAGSFLFLQDGVPLRSAGFANVNGLFDAQTPFAQRVEVIRGPGDVAYGANAQHGLINVITRDPLAPTDDRAVIAATLGSFGRVSATAEWLGDDAYIAMFASTDDGYRDDSGGAQYKGMAAKGWQDGDRTIRMRASFHRLQQETAGFVVGERAFADDVLRRSNPNPDAFRDSDNLQLMADISDRLGPWSVSVTPYFLSSDMRFRLHFLPSQAIEDNDHWAVGMQSSAQRAFSSGDVLFGLDAERASGGLKEEQFLPTFGSFPIGIHHDYAVTSDTIAPFIRGRFRPTDRVMVQAGARLTHTAYAYDNNAGDGAVGRFLRPSDREDDVSVVTGKIAGTYALSDQALLYVSAARGARAPQTADLYRLQINESVGDVDAETLDTAEIGWRWRGERARAELAAYWGDKENFRFRNSDGFTVVDGATTHRGIEFSGEWAMTSDLSVFGEGSVARHDYAFDDVVGNASEIIRRGNEVDTAPSFTASVGAVWTISPAMQARWRVHHVGPYFTNAANTAEYEGHTVSDVSFGADLPGNARADILISNVFDTRYATRADFAFGTERFFPGEERALRLSISRSF